MHIYVLDSSPSQPAHRCNFDSIHGVTLLFPNPTRERCYFSLLFITYWLLCIISFESSAKWNFFNITLIKNNKKVNNAYIYLHFFYKFIVFFGVGVISTDNQGRFIIGLYILSEYKLLSICHAYILHPQETVKDIRILNFISHWHG